MKAQDRKIVLRNAELSMEARFLWILIDTWADADGTNARPKVETLMGASGKKKKWVEKYLKELREEGYLKVLKEPGKTGTFPHNKYILLARPLKQPMHVGHIKTLYQVPYTSNDDLALESEAILRPLPDPVREDPPAYGVL